MLELICKTNIQTLGIQDADGNWDINKLKEHILSCPKCYKATKLIESGLVNEDGDWNMELGCKIDPVEIGIIDKEGNWDYGKLELHTEFCPECSELYQKTDRVIRAVFGIEEIEEQKEDNKRWH